jgi:AraC-like DNA-binding protein
MTNAAHTAGAGADIVLSHWRIDGTADGDQLVLPDGCRDLIVHVAADGRPCWFVSELAQAAAWVPSRCGERFMGWRLQPGACIDETPLLAALRARPEIDAPEVRALLHDCVKLDVRLTEMLQGLATAPGVGAAARLLGVHERSLERWVGRGTGRPPGFWQALARARRCARALPTGVPLVELALAQGYADQAHMSCEVRRWFGLTPAALRRSPALQQLVQQAGFN